MKGFKDKKGKFHPTGQHSGLKKSGIKKTVSTSSGNADELKLRKKVEMGENNPLNIGLSDEVEGSSYRNDNISQEVRDEGNSLVEQMVNMTKQNHPEREDYILSQPHIYNDYSTIQNSLAHAKNTINQLLEWSDDGDPTTWKWKSPIPITNREPKNFHYEKDGKQYSKGNPNSKTIYTDGQNNGWESDAYKGQMAITMMTPQFYIELASPRVAESGERNDIRGESHSEETIDELTHLMKGGVPIDTVFLQTDGNGQVTGHEGLHRAMSAIKAGIRLMPVYTYSYDGYDDKTLEEISNEPRSILKPDNRY